MVYVTQKVQADLFALVDTYGQMTEDYAQNLIHDLRILLDEQVIDRIDFLWTRPGTNQVVGSYTYKVISGGVGLVDERSGGIRYEQSLQQASFNVMIYNNSRWYALPQEDRADVEQLLHFPWGPGGSLDYSQGRWQADRTYSKDGYGLGRERFAGW